MIKALASLVVVTIAITATTTDYAPLRIRTTAADSAVTVHAIAGKAMLEAAPLLRLLGGRLDSTGPDRAQFRVGTVRGELFDGLPYARIDSAIVPLAIAPARKSGRFFVPMQFATDLLPRAGTGIVYDVVRRELRRGVGAPVVATAPPAARPVQPAAAKRTVVIDAGHGGRDGGARGQLPDGSYVWEKTITLGVAQKLADALTKRGVIVKMTRARDTLIALADRGRIANRSDGVLFISIHVNAAGPAERRPAAVRGFETYFLAEAQSDDERRVEAMENESVQFETAEPEKTHDALTFILNDLAQNEHLRESSELASTIQFGLLGAHPGPNRGVKQANFAVLRSSYMPAVLIETGFGSNKAEAFWLSSAAGQRALAGSIADATMEYLAAYETRLKVSRSQ